MVFLESRCGDTGHCSDTLVVLWWQRCDTVVATWFSRKVVVCPHCGFPGKTPCGNTVIEIWWYCGDTVMAQWSLWVFSWKVVPCHCADVVLLWALLWHFFLLSI